ncbi:MULTISPECIES: YebC/PmpR family DNA-binding transcriptional regulator [Reichenbachiella]|uniref:Probable transcriptional regulatory protein SAMN04488028_102120 n=1 Tax=Reichenbachiella agariperforans TaxID=156994 RepID=A0A1M6N691_REIAG|nr:MULTISPECIES: YebC/PmpR family DNA-binding transcriptional regulator [Reichenbachiella]MBU2915748.1 YebC/PmpR family DNA-binding transcriptional regulator [Reichenbachiella agariperforans]RJE71986.1 transcriptional regulator [Reichenbachiella sp. MSK19-1]SHJ91255.1 DNA-binding regulatory protein, YebC/PmpR family [Reichenbachiella agariperforans]
MSGHSKWSTIKRKKGALDAKRGKIFGRLSKEITIAVKEGNSGDAEANPRLRLAILNAKGSNMPKDNIERAIKKGLGGDAASYFEQDFEGYAAHGVAVFVETLTDNQNRTVQEVRAAFTKNNGSLGTNGSLEFIFDRKGVFSLPVPSEMDLDEFELELIEAGAEEVEIEDGFVIVHSAMEDFGSLNKKLDSLGLELENAELQRLPKTTVKVDDEAFQEVMKLIDMLEDHDDVQKVWHNLEMGEGQEELLEN